MSFALDSTVSKLLSRDVYSVQSDIKLLCKKTKMLLESLNYSFEHMVCKAHIFLHVTMLGTKTAGSSCMALCQRSKQNVVMKYVGLVHARTDSQQHD